MSEEQKQALIERCEKISEWREKYGDYANVILPAVEAQQIAQIALATLTATPVAWHIYQWRESPKGWDWYLTRAFASEPNNSDGWRSVALFTRPVPAADLAELVPDKWSLEQALKFVEDYTPPSEEESVLFAVNSFRAAILRKIEEAK